VPFSYKKLYIFLGEYEICVTARVNYGSLRVTLEIFAHNEEQLKQTITEYQSLTSAKRAVYVRTHNYICSDKF
jgi:hypothetical protein